MKCKDANEMMDAWIDGELPPDQRAVFENHLVRCRICSEQAEYLERLSGLLDTQPSTLPSADLERKTLSLFIREAGSGGMVYWWKGLGWAMQTAMAASGVIGLGIGYQLGNGWIGVQQLAQYSSISGFLFSAGDLLLSWA